MQYTDKPIPYSQHLQCAHWTHCKENTHINCPSSQEMKLTRLLAACCWVLLLILTVAFSVKYLQNLTHVEFTSTRLAAADYPMIAICPLEAFRMGLLKSMAKGSESSSKWTLLTDLAVKNNDPKVRQGV